MELITIDIPADSADREFYLATICDVHVGARDFDRDLFTKYINWITGEPNAIPIILGDLAEHIAPLDKRWDARTVDQSYPPRALANLPHHELQDFIKLIEPITDRIVMVGMGNHELKIGTRGDYDPHLNLVERLGGALNENGLPQRVKLDSALSRSTPPADGNYEGFIKLRFIKSKKVVATTKIYYHHGAKGGSPSSVTSYLDKLLSEYQTDIVMVGHGHRMAAHERSRIEPNKRWKDIKIKSSLGVMHGSWKRGWGAGYVTYEVKAGYTPRALGPVLIKINPMKKTWVALLGDRPWEVTE